MTVYNTLYSLSDGSDYTIPDAGSLLLRFSTTANRSCFNIPIVNDNITEATRETFNITLPEVAASGLNVNVDRTPSTVTIVDDDGKWLTMETQHCFKQ